MLERSEYAPYMEINRCNIEAKPELYKQRQSIVEHPYGTIKRGWGFDYIITKKGIKRASADAGLMFIAYNLKRLVNIIGKEGFRKYLRELILALVAKTGLTHIIKLKTEPVWFELKKILTAIITRLKRPIITPITSNSFSYLNF
jgi:hypothetical protein